MRFRMMVKRGKAIGGGGELRPCSSNEEAITNKKPIWMPKPPKILISDLGRLEIQRLHTDTKENTQSQGPRVDISRPGEGGVIMRGWKMAAEGVARRNPLGVTEKISRAKGKLPRMGQSD